MAPNRQPRYSEKTLFYDKGSHTPDRVVWGESHLPKIYAERKIGNGAKILFLEHNWVNEAAIAPQFPRLYNITFTKHMTVNIANDNRLRQFSVQKNFAGRDCRTMGDTSRDNISVAADICYSPVISLTVTLSLFFATEGLGASGRNNKAVEQVEQ